MSITGPAAPKDARKQRPYFYVIRNKEIFASKQPDGRGIQFFYEDMGRLIDSARITGNIQDENILDLLKNTAGFRKLVHSIGITVSCENINEKVDFIFQMYGQKDMYGGGTNLTASLLGNQSEVIIDLDEIEWKEDDKEPGQIRFEFDTPNILANCSVRFFVNDGFEVPEVAEEETVDIKSDAYQRMCEKSLITCGNTARLHKAIAKARNNEEVTIAYIGGSITQGAGATPINTECYAYKSFLKLKELLGNSENIKYVKAGVGGTPSELGMIRYDRDVTKDGEIQPDIVIVEFAVNDEGDETKGHCYESLVRKILKAENEPAVILLFSVFTNDWNLQERLIPVGQHYELPMVSIKDAVVEQFYAKKENGHVMSKNQFFYDAFHPTNLGHTVMADCIAYMFEQVVNAYDNKDTAFDNTSNNLQKQPVYGNTYDDVELYDRENIAQIAKVDEGSFTDKDEELQAVEMNLDLATTKEFPNNWKHIKGARAAFSCQLECRALVVVHKDSGAVDVGKADVYVDGALVKTLDPHINGWVHCNPIIVLEDGKVATHHIEIRMASGDEDKTFTILGFGVVK